MHTYVCGCALVGVLGGAALNLGKRGVAKALLDAGTTGIAYETVQLPGGERVAFLFTVKQFDGKVSFWQILDLNKEIIIQQADVGLVQTNGVEDVYNAVRDNS